MFFCLGWLMCTPCIDIKHQSNHFFFSSVLKGNVFIWMFWSRLWFNRWSHYRKLRFSSFSLLFFNFFFFNLMLIINYWSSIRFKDCLKIDVLNNIHRLVIFRYYFLHFQNLITKSYQVLFHSSMNFWDFSD